ncbi:PH domain-containing protein [Streptomyces coeruleorubidus]|uniref:PH domain-containing protein n=1 Tax=Streptomyces coeruleorubidus TaxID=116188 RepID=UPI0033DB8FB2
MHNTWIALDAAARRKNWWWTGYLTAIFGGLGVAVALTETDERFWWVFSVSICWLLSVIYMINRGYGRTLLTSDRIVFRTFISRRSIPWGEIVNIEKRRHQTRSGEWWDLRIVRTHGRSLAIPGAFSGRPDDAAFEEKFTTIREYWARSARTE